MAKLIYGIYEDEEVLMDAITSLKGQGVVCKDVQSPFPIHGIDKLLNVPRTRLSVTAFIYGITGTSLALLMTWYMMVSDWPINIGGKPNMLYYMNLPAFIPVTFELTVFCAAHGMVLTFLLRSKLLPGVSAPIPHPRITNDRFVLHVDIKDEGKINEVVSLIKASGASEVMLKSMQFA
ncbi:MAG TPA: DUF3341 domain-containing protein [Saprospiraceae bacterium]|nr:DUF3341 domain-containing protein [Saprospiraceae bacterium]HNS12312.1 DUF3341 domain-containing protein [Bacteroidia bacterium]